MLDHIAGSAPVNCPPVNQRYGNTMSSSSEYVRQVYSSMRVFQCKIAAQQCCHNHASTPPADPDDAVQYFNAGIDWFEDHRNRHKEYSSLRPKLEHLEPKRERLLQQLYNTRPGRDIETYNKLHAAWSIWKDEIMQGYEERLRKHPDLGQEIASSAKKMIDIIDQQIETCKQVMQESTAALQRQYSSLYEQWVKVNDKFIQVNNQYQTLPDFSSDEIERLACLLKCDQSAQLIVSVQHGTQDMAQLPHYHKKEDIDHRDPDSHTIEYQCIPPSFTTIPGVWVINEDGRLYLCEPVTNEQGQAVAYLNQYKGDVGTELLNHYSQEVSKLEPGYIGISKGRSEEARSCHYWTNTQILKQHQKNAPKAMGNQLLEYKKRYRGHPGFREPTQRLRRLGAHAPELE